MGHHASKSRYNGTIDTLISALAMKSYQAAAAPVRLAGHPGRLVPVSCRCSS